MNNQRAKEIFDSLGVIEVFHNGSPVWIEGIDNDAADVRYLKSNRRSRVPLTELAEG
ncbi:MAG: small, acid-soluble spore protein, H family [Firmicutes bacterium]|nr:small, acid-soluble spore protein, H family [Bacillota bacterium]